MRTSSASDPLWRYVLRSGLRSTRSACRIGLDFLLPPSCASCGREREHDSPQTVAFCLDCDTQLRPPQGTMCRRCAAPVGPFLDTAQGCIHCRNDNFHFDGVIRLGVYRDLLRTCVLKAKSLQGETLARLLTDVFFAERTDDWSAGRWDVVVPVPHHWPRRFARGQAASEAIAERLAYHLHLPCNRRLLRKVRRTPQQAGSPPSVRRKQQRQAFMSTVDVKGQRILLVDDVLTTGATADEAAKMLKHQGAASVTVAVLARGLGELG